MKKIDKIKESKGIIKTRNEFTGDINFTNDFNIKELWISLHETQIKLNQIIDRLNHLSDQLEGKNETYL